MHITQKQIDYINKKYTFLDNEALNALIKEQFRIYMYNNKDIPNRKSRFTFECVNDCARLRREYDLDTDEVFVRLNCQFEALFKKTFPHLVQNT